MGEVNGDPAEQQPVPMQSHVGWALLGLIIERPSYGYELAHRFDRVFADKLSLAGTSHAYRTLERLKERGLIEELPGTRSGTGRQPKPGYRATREGMAAHHDWIQRQVLDDRRRHHVFMLELTALVRDPDGAMSVLADYEKSCLHDNAASAIPQDGAAGHNGALALQARLIAEEKRLMAGARVAWARFARGEITAFARADAPGHEAPEQASDPGARAGI